MSLESFVKSRPLTLGIELELQLVNLHDYDLVGSAPDVLRDIERQKLDMDIKPEITNSMIEMATGICDNYTDALQQLTAIRDVLVDSANRLNVGICGGGTHAFQHWGDRQIYDNPRFNHLSDLYGYLAKQFTIFGQHVHIGCPGPDVALYVMHGLSRFIPHFIALSASSPFVQGDDTGFQSARLNSVFAFPMSGRAPFVDNWSDFITFFDKMTHTGVIKSMKDFYWDIRPKPEYGTIEVRVMDTPLTVLRAAQIAAYIQCLARYLIVERPFQPLEDDYLVYTFNRFQACRFGYAGTYVDPRSHDHRSIAEDMLETFARIEQHAIELGADAACQALRADVAGGRNDATTLRSLGQTTQSLPEVVQNQCTQWCT
jgi:carboxylate-amine ligase